MLLGMMCANFVAVKLNLLPEDEQRRMDALIRQLPVSLPQNKAHPDPRELLQLMYQDKKVKDGQIQLILPEKIGKVRSVILKDENLVIESFAYLFSLIK